MVAGTGQGVALMHRSMVHCLPGQYSKRCHTDSGHTLGGGSVRDHFIEALHMLTLLRWHSNDILAGLEVLSTTSYGISFQ